MRELPDLIPPLVNAPEASMGQVRIGALCWNQYTAWPALLEAGVRADRLGHDSFWT